MFQKIVRKPKHLPNRGIKKYIPTYFSSTKKAPITKGFFCYQYANLLALF
jgi:hypothetical protein